MFEGGAGWAHTKLFANNQRTITHLAVRNLFIVILCSRQNSKKSGGSFNNHTKFAYHAPTYFLERNAPGKSARSTHTSDTYTTARIRINTVLTSAWCLLTMNQNAEWENKAQQHTKPISQLYWMILHINSLKILLFKLSRCWGGALYKQKTALSRHFWDTIFNKK